MANECGIMFPKHGGIAPEDNCGCVLHSGHVGPHRFRAADGQIVDWENDWENDWDQIIKLFQMICTGN